MPVVITCSKPGGQADLIRAEVVAIPEKQPIISSDIFTTQAGLRQAGTQRQPQTPLTSVSRMVKHLYDHVHEAYDGHYDETNDRYIDHRTIFFDMDDLARLAARFQNEPPETP